MDDKINGRGGRRCVVVEKRDEAESFNTGFELNINPIALDFTIPLLSVLHTERAYGAEGYNAFLVPHGFVDITPSFPLPSTFDSPDAVEISLRDAYR